MWTIEVWVRPVRADRGRWEVVGEADAFEEARATVIAVAEEHGVSRAHREAPDTEIRWMRAYRGRGFCCWTGSDSGQ